jgi:hypothetical protein
MSAVPGQITNSLFVTAEPGNFSTGNRPGAPAVTVKRVRALQRRFQALIYKTPLNEDVDGAPNAYSVPLSVTNLNRRFGAIDHINNATNQVPPTFHASGANTFFWRGVVHMQKAAATAAGISIDDRAFLQDHHGDFPVFQDATQHFYVSTTALPANTGVPETDQSHWIDATAIPYAALGGLRASGVALGDFGLAIRASTGSRTGFIFGDFGGGPSVGEYSRKLIRALFGGVAGNEEICFIVFPGTAARRTVTLPHINSSVSSEIAKLSDVINTFEIAWEFTYPANWRSISSETLTTILVQQPQIRVQRDNVMNALRAVGYAPRYLIDL